MHRVTLTTICCKPSIDSSCRCRRRLLDLPVMLLIIVIVVIDTRCNAIGAAAVAGATAGGRRRRRRRQSAAAIVCGPIDLVVIIAIAIGIIITATVAVRRTDRGCGCQHRCGRNFVAERCTLAILGGGHFHPVPNRAQPNVSGLGNGSE